MENKFKQLTDECYELYESFMESGFDKNLAAQLTQQYIGYAFERSAMEARYYDENRYSRKAILDRYRKRTDEMKKE